MTTWTATRRTTNSGGSPTVNLGASSLVRVVDNGEDDPEFVRRPVGFITEAGTRGRVYRQRYPLGVMRPGLRIRVWLRRATGDLWPWAWWRWSCPCCRGHVGGWCPTWPEALQAALDHANSHGSER
jgi:hypothetical protein